MIYNGLDAREKAAAQEELEHMIDKSSVADVLEMISQICLEKEGHIHENWPGTGSETLASQWREAADRIEKFSRKIFV